MFSRHGGSGSAPYNSLNLSFSVGDTDANVLANRDTVQKALGIDTLCSVHQTHSDNVIVIDDACQNEIPGYDALITAQKGVGLLIQQADCQAVLFHDPVTGSIGAAHSGWKGSVQNIIAQTIRAMRVHFGSKPTDMTAVISPSLGPCCAEFIHYREELPQWMHGYQVKANFFDFWAISKKQLLDAGVPEMQIDITRICTKCNVEFFSYRRSVQKGQQATGRNGSIIALPSQKIYNSKSQINGV
ncbi:MAG: copper oxidase [Desulfobulbus propionicus]|nr:MAG: copper oxidase [Desulfobulbus propionicus]